MASSGMGDTKQVIINVKLLSSEAIKNIQDLTKKVDMYKAAMERMKAAGNDNTEAYHRLNAMMKEAQAAIRSNQKVLVENIKAQKQNGDSINALRAQMKELRSEYENMTKAERESAKGTDILQHINDITTELKGLEEQQQDFSRSVGDYAQALTGLPFGKVIAGFNSLSNGTGKLSVALKNGITGVKAFGQQLWQLMKIPVVAVISAIVAVLAKLVSEIKKNDEAMTAMQRVMASLKPILDIINKAFAVLVDIVAKAANAVAGFISGIMSVIPGLKDYAKAEQDVVNATDALEDAEREYTVNSAKRSKEVSELRSKSVEKDKYSYEQRKKFLQQAIDLEQQDLQEAKDIAQQKLDIAKQEASLTVGAKELTEEVYNKLSDEVKNHLAELEAAVYQTEQAFNDGTRRMKSQMSEFTEKEKQEQKQRAQQAAQARKERLKNEREAYKELQNLMVNSIHDIQSKEIATTKASYEQQIAALKERLATEKNLTKQAKQYINAQIVLLESDLQIKLGDIREKYQSEQWEKELDNAKNYYTKLLSNLSTEEARVQVRLKINDLDTQALEKQAKTVLDSYVKTFERAEMDLQSLDYDQLAMKYGAVWEQMGITAGDNIAKMRALVYKYEQDMKTAQVEYERDMNEIRKSGANEALMIQKESDDKQWNLERKHQELMRALAAEDNYAIDNHETDLYLQKEVEKTRILQQQAEERARIAREEYERIDSERVKYSQEEIAAMYGSIEEYDNILLASLLKVKEAENDVAQATADTAAAVRASQVAMANTFGQALQNMQSMTSAFGSLFTTLAEGDEEMQKYANALAYTDIMMNMAMGIASAVAKGMEMGWPAAAIMIPLGIATVVSGIAEAIALQKKNSNVKSAPKFSEGGSVGGKVTERTDDTVTAKLSVGEYVIPSKIVKKHGISFFDRLIGKKPEKGWSIPHFATGGLVSVPNLNAMVNTEMNIDWDMMEEVMTNAVSKVQPVVSVKEITHGQNRVRIKESVARD